MRSTDIAPAHGRLPDDRNSPRDIRSGAAGRVPGATLGPAPAPSGGGAALRRPAAPRIARRVVLGALLPAGCARDTGPPAPAPPPGAPALWLVQFGWHTEVALALQPGDALARLLAPWLPPAPLTGFGFGARGYFTEAEPGLADLSRATLPGPGAVIAAPLPIPPGPGMAEAWVALPATEAARAALAGFLLGEIARDTEGRALPIGPAYRPGAHFFEARRRYALPYTSNTWAVEALAAAGLPLDPTGVMTAGAAMREARRAARLLAGAG